MIHSIYENHTYKDADFPVIFNYQTLQQNAYSSDMMHWHESIELIYVVEGSCTALCGLIPVTAHAGEMILINCNDLHSFKPHTATTSYYCLIIDKLIYEHLALSIEEIAFQNHITHPTICHLYSEMIDELNHALPYYKLAIKSKITTLLIELLRSQVLQDDSTILSTRYNPKITMVKNAISYIRKNLISNPSLEDICAHIGFSKYYFCRTFKEVTNKTVIEYINHLRCQYAKKLLLSGNYTVTETSELCGFNSLPYFCRLYKKHLGVSPSETKH